MPIPPTRIAILAKSIIADWIIPKILFVTPINFSEVITAKSAISSPAILFLVFWRLSFMSSATSSGDNPSSIITIATLAEPFFSPVKS